MCNEGFGRGVIEEVKENGFDAFDGKNPQDLGENNRGV